MRAATTVGGWTGERFAHEAFVYETDDQVTERVLPYLEEGLEREEPTIVVSSELVRGLIEDELGPRVEELTVFEDSSLFWQGSGLQTLAAYQESMRPLLELGRPWRLVGEPAWLLEPGGEQWSLLEAVANDAFAEYPYYSLCLHDRRRVPGPLIENQLRSHPLVWDGHDVVPSPLYEPTEDFIRSFEPPWEPRPEQREQLTVTDCSTARRWVRRQAEQDSGERADDVVLAVHELVANAVEAAGSAELSTWRVNGAQVWEVADSGSGLHDASAGYAPPPLELLTGGRGLWLVRSLADEMLVRPTGPGTAVRAYFDRA